MNIRFRQAAGSNAGIPSNAATSAYGQHQVTGMRNFLVFVVCAVLPPGIAGALITIDRTLCPHTDPVTFAFPVHVVHVKRRQG